MRSPELTPVVLSGVGRIGALVARELIENPHISFLGMNDGRYSAGDAAKRIREDGIHGRFHKEQITYDDENVYFYGLPIPVFNFREVEEAPWSDLDKSPIVVEATGAFRKKETIQKHLDKGALGAVLTAPGEESDFPTVVIGVNDHMLEEYLSAWPVVSNSSCSTNALGSPLSVLSDAFAGRMLSHDVELVHAYTASQNLFDGGGEDLSNRRSAINNIIPYKSGSQREIARLIGEKAGESWIECVRVSNDDGSLAIAKLEFDGNIKEERIVEALEEACKTTHDGIMKLVDEGMSAQKVVGYKESSVIDRGRLSVRSGPRRTKVRLEIFYDNEGAYSARTAELTQKCGEILLAA